MLAKVELLSTCLCVPARAFHEETMYVGTFARRLSNVVTHFLRHIHLSIKGDSHLEILIYLQMFCRHLQHHIVE